MNFDQLTDEERVGVRIGRLITGGRPEGTVITRHIGRLRITFKFRRRHPLWGRLGDGWNWALGFQCNRHVLTVLLLVASVTFRIEPRKPTGETS